MLASLDGTIGPAEEARIPVTDEGLTRGDGAFEVARLYGGRPFALEDHMARLATTCEGIRLTVRRGRAASGDRRAAGGGRTRGRPAAGRPHPRRPPHPHDRAAAPATGVGPRGDRDLRAQPRARRAQDALVRRQHARRADRARAGLRRGALRDPARPRPRGTRRGPSSGSPTGASTRRRSRTGSSPRSPGATCSTSATERSEPARSTTRSPPRRRSSRHRCAR